jgi:hypothetical protein
VTEFHNSDLDEVTLSVFCSSFILKLEWLSVRVACPSRPQ